MPLSAITKQTANVTVTIRKGEIFRSFRTLEALHNMEPKLEVSLLRAGGSATRSIAQVPASPGTDKAPIWDHTLSSENIDVGDELLLEVKDAHKWPRKDVLIGSASVSLTQEMVSRHTFETSVQMFKVVTKGGIESEHTGNIQVSLRFTSTSSLETRKSVSIESVPSVRDVLSSSQAAGTYRWVGIESGQPIPKDAISAGTTRADGEVWVGRHQGEAGKINAKNGNMYLFRDHSTFWHGQQKADILCIAGAYSWVPIESGKKIPPNALRSGSSSKDGICYVARYNGEAGKINVENGIMSNFFGHASGKVSSGGTDILVFEGVEEISDLSSTMASMSSQASTPSRQEIPKRGTKSVSIDPAELSPSSVAPSRGKDRSLTAPASSFKNDFVPDEASRLQLVGAHYWERGVIDRKGAILCTAGVRRWFLGCHACFGSRPKPAAPAVEDVKLAAEPGNPV